MVGNHRVNQIKTKLDKLEREEKERNKMIINFDRSKIEEQQFLIKKSESVKNNLEQKTQKNESPQIFIDSSTS